MLFFKYIDHPKLAALSIVLLFGSWIGCQKEGTITPNIRTELCITTQHHEQILPHIEVYLRYFADSFPGYDDLSRYDTFFTTDQWGYRCYKGLPFGKHWLTGIGFDSLLQEPVRGSVQVEMSFEGANKDTVLYVTEY